MYFVLTNIVDFSVKENNDTSLNRATILLYLMFLFTSFLILSNENGHFCINSYKESCPTLVVSFKKEKCINHLGFKRLAKLSGSSLQSKVKRGHRGSIFIKLSPLLSLSFLHFFLPPPANGLPLAVNVEKRVVSLGHLIPTAWPMRDVQLQSARLIASPSPLHLPPNWLLSRFLHLCLPGPSEQELLFCSIITRQRRGTCHWPGPRLTEPGLAAQE